MKPSETKDESMQRVDTRYLLQQAARLSQTTVEKMSKRWKLETQLVALNEQASRKSSPVHAESVQEELRRKEQHIEERKMGKKREWCFQETI